MASLEASADLPTEPGYYADGRYGIRIENVVVVREAKTPNNFGGKGYLGFERLTMVRVVGSTSVFHLRCALLVVSDGQEPHRYGAAQHV